MKIYVSSSCFNGHQLIKDAVQECVDNNIINIELSGGTLDYHELESDLLNLKDTHGLDLVCHNYFPPPSNPFVVNLASQNKEIEHHTLEHFKRALDLSHKLGSKVFSLHAGFYMDIPVGEIGKNIKKQELYNKRACIDTFASNFEKLEQIAGNDIELFVENNVIAQHNFDNYNGNPLMYTCIDDFNEMTSVRDYPTLIDLAHLYVSCNTLNLNFEEQADYFTNRSKYIHISDNNGVKDQNKGIINNSPIHNFIEGCDFSEKIITLEIYEGVEKIKSAIKLLEE